MMKGKSKIRKKEESWEIKWIEKREKIKKITGKIWNSKTSIPERSYIKYKDHSIGQDKWVEMIIIKLRKD